MYKLTDSKSIFKDGSCIPMCLGNVDYQQYLVWAASGNTPTPADPVALIVTPPDKTDRLADLLIAKGVLNLADVASIKASDK